MRQNLSVSADELARFNTYINKISPNGTMMSLGHLLEWSAAQYGDDIALETEDHQISYTSLYHRACMFSELLKQQGVQHSDRVLVWVENSIEFYIAYFGALQIGAVVAPLNIYLTEHELTHIINDSQAKLVVTAKSFSDRLTQAHNHAPIIFIEDVIDLDAPATMDSFSIADKDPDELALLLYTSGTTGLPKGVMLSTRNALTNSCQAIARIKFPRCRILCVLPLFHSFTQNTCVWTPLLYGCTIILVPKIERRYIAAGLAKKPDIFLGVPALYGLLCMMKTAPIEGISYFICGADALPDKIRGLFALIYNRKIANGYGLSESSPFIAVDLDDVTEPTSCVGRPCALMEVEIRDQKGAVLDDGTVGELWVKGPNIMLGYYNAPEQTANVLQNGWLATGDLAYINHHGKIVIVGREKDLIKHKGFNIYPQEIENVLMSHPDVLRAGVIGKPDEAGEIPIAVVQTRVESSAIEQELIRLCKERLASYKIPREFIIMRNDPPLTTTGKINKKQLKKDLFKNER